MQLTKWTVDGWRSAPEGTVLIHSSFDQQEIHAPFKHYWGRLKKGMAVEAHVHHVKPNWLLFPMDRVSSVLILKIKT